MAHIKMYSADEQVIPVAGSVTEDTFYAHQRPEPVDPMVATQTMWWRATGRLAYPQGATFSAAELPLLVSNAEHETNMRAGITDRDAAVQHPAVELAPIQTEPLVPIETRLITSAPEVRDEPERHRGGRPRLPRDEARNVIR